MYFTFTQRPMSVSGIGCSQNFEPRVLESEKKNPSGQVKKHALIKWFMIRYSKTCKNKKCGANSPILHIADILTPKTTLLFDNRCLRDKIILTRELWTMCKNGYNFYNKLSLIVNICTIIITITMCGCRGCTIWIYVKTL